MADKRIGIALVLSAYDKASVIIDNVVTKANKKLQTLSKQADKMADASFKAGKQLLAGGAAMAAPIVYVTKRAMDFEEAMASVGKVLNMQNGSRELNAMGDQAKQLAVYLAKSSTEAANMIAALAQGGVEKQDLSKVAKIAGEIAVAFDISADVAGDRFMKMKNAMGASIDAAKESADAMNFLSDKTAASASQLLDFMSAGGAGVARVLKMTGPEIEAFGAMMVEMGKSGEEAGTIMERFTKNIMKDRGAFAIFSKAGGGNAGLMKLLELGSKIKSPQKQMEFFRKLGGEYATDLALFSSNYGRLAELTTSVASKQNYANSVYKEFNNRSNTTAFRLAKAKANFEILAITIGNQVLPRLTTLIERTIPIIQKVNEWAQKNKGLVVTVLKITAGLSALAIVTGVLAFIWGGLLRTFSIASKVLGGVFKAVEFLTNAEKMNVVATRIQIFWSKALTVVTRIFNAVLKASPWILVAMLAIAAITIIYKNWDRIRTFFEKLWEDVKAIFNKMWDWVKGFAKGFWDAGANIVKNIWEGIKSMASKPVEAIKDIVQKIRDHLPFSPAKIGPLKDIHRIKLIETIAQTIKPASMVQAMNRTLQVVANAKLGITGAMPTAPAMAYSGSNVTFNYNPTIQISGSATREDANNLASMGMREFEKMMRNYEQNRARRSF